jgi:transcriptional regulator of NAD metabolism
MLKLVVRKETARLLKVKIYIPSYGKGADRCNVNYSQQLAVFERFWFVSKNDENIQKYGSFFHLVPRLVLSANISLVHL